MTLRVARKDWTCATCGGPIRRRHMYNQTSIKMFTVWVTTRTCAACFNKQGDAVSEANPNLEVKDDG